MPQVQPASVPAAPRWWSASRSSAGVLRPHPIDRRPFPAAPFVALVPGTATVVMRLDLPSGLRGAAREAVALRQAADRLGQSRAALALRPFRSGRGAGWDAILVADQAQASAWRAAVAPAGSWCRAVLPDWLALPAGAGVWTVRVADGMVQVRLETDDGFSAEPDLAALMLGHARTTRPPAAVLRLGAPDPAVDAALAGLMIGSAAAALPAERTVTQPFMAGELALDLAADPQAAEAALRGLFARLRLPLILGAVGLLAGIVATMIETRQLQTTAASLQAAIMAEVRRDFLPEGPIIDIPAQVTREVARRHQANPTAEAPDSLQLLHRAGTVLAADPARLVAISHPASGGLRLELIVADFARLDALTAALRQAGLGVVPGQSSTTAPGQVNAVLTVTAGG